MRKISFLIMALVAMTMVAGNPAKAVDRNNLDLNATPGNNFYQYACGGWMLNNPLDPQYARFGTFDQLRENCRDQVKDIITTLGTKNTRGSLKQKVGDLYALGMDSVRLNQEGMSPLTETINAIKSLNRSQFASAIADQHKGIGDPFFNSAVMADLKNSNENMLYLMQGGLGMGDRDYYLDSDANTIKVRNAYINYIQKLFQLIGYKKGNAKKAAQHVMAIETALAQVAMTREDTRDYSKLYNLTTVNQLKSDYPNINWDQYFNTLNINGVETLCVFQPKSLAKVNEMLKTLKEEDVREYLIFKYVDAAAPYLSDAFADANFDMYSRAMSGQQVKMPRWKHSLDVPNTLLGEAVGQLYVEKYFPADSKKKMQQLVDNLKKALGEHIAGLSWMSPKTKVNALVKLNSFTVKIGYPDKWRDYTNLDIDPRKSFWENVLNARRFQAEYEYDQLGKPVDKERWYMTPQTVNAYYEPSTNEICFPAGILQAPYFDPNADDACNYGAIGVVIGHEMTHGFDDGGRMYDKDGNMHNWWKEADGKNFTERTDKFADFFSNINVLPDLKANGRLTLGENLADHGGLQVSWAAYKNATKYNKLEDKDGLTADQRFFHAYAGVLAGNITEAEIRNRTKSDPHSLGRFRVNGALPHIDACYEAFGVKEGDKLFIPKKERLDLW